MIVRFLSEADLEMAEIALRYKSAEPGLAKDSYRKLRVSPPE